MQLQNTTSTTRSTPNSSTSQRAKILNVLISARGEWIPLPEIVACAAQYNARIFELRRLGFTIVNRTEECDGVRLSWFKLVPGPGQAGSSTTPPPGARDDANDLQQISVAQDSLPFPERRRA